MNTSHPESRAGSRVPSPSFRYLLACSIRTDRVTFVIRFFFRFVCEREREREERFKDRNFALTLRGYFLDDWKRGRYFWTKGKFLLTISSFKSVCILILKKIRETRNGHLFTLEERKTWTMFRVNVSMEIARWISDLVFLEIIRSWKTHFR